MWKCELRRVLVIVAGASLIGLAGNALSGRPVPLLSADGPGAWPQRAARITIPELRDALAGHKAVLILDVRGDGPFRAGHPEAAVHAPYESFIDGYNRRGLAARLRAAEIVVVLCESDECPSADRAAKLLDDLGHAGARVLQGGWAAYRASGLAVAP